MAAFALAPPVLPAARPDPSAALRGYVHDLLAAGGQLADRSRALRRQSDQACARLQTAYARLDGGSGRVRGR